MPGHRQTAVKGLDFFGSRGSAAPNNRCGLSTTSGILLGRRRARRESGNPFLPRSSNRRCLMRGVHSPFDGICQELKYCWMSPSSAIRPCSTKRIAPSGKDWLAHRSGLEQGIRIHRIRLAARARAVSSFPRNATAIDDSYAHCRLASPRGPAPRKSVRNRLPAGGGQSGANSSLKPNSLLFRENTGNFIGAGPASPNRRSK